MGALSPAKLLPTKDNQEGTFSELMAWKTHSDRLQWPWVILSECPMKRSPECCGSTPWI